MSSPFVFRTVYPPFSRRPLLSVVAFRVSGPRPRGGFRRGVATATTLLAENYYERRQQEPTILADFLQPEAVNRLHPGPPPSSHLLMFIPDTLRSCMVEPDVSTYLQAPSVGQVHISFNYFVSFVYL